MGDASSQLSKETLIYAFCYELVLFLLQRFPWIHKRRFARMAMEYCKPYWVEWKTSLTIKQVDKQVEQLKDQWEKEEKEEKEQRANTLAEKAQELFPDATVTPLPDAIVPSVMIVREAAPDASDEVKALGGEMRITYRLD